MKDPITSGLNAQTHTFKYSPAELAAWLHLALMYGEDVTWAPSDLSALYQSGPKNMKEPKEPGAGRSPDSPAGCLTHRGALTLVVLEWPRASVVVLVGWLNTRKHCFRFFKGSSDSNVSFDELCSLLRHLGFHERIRGSHHIFTRENVEEILNLQPIGAKAKAYQVKQARGVVLRYKLAGESDE